MSTPRTCASATTPAPPPPSACSYGTRSAPSCRARPLRRHRRVRQRPGRGDGPLRGLHRLPRPDDLDGLLQRTVERARDMLDGDSAYLLLATDDETELEVRASTGLPSARQRFARVPVEAGTGRYGSARMPAVHDDLSAVPGAVPLLADTGMRSVVTVPLKVEGRLTGSLASRPKPPAATATRRRCGCSSPPTASPSPSSPRAWASWNACAAARSPSSSRRPTCSGHPRPRPDARPHGPDDRPTLATWCAVYTIADQSSEPSCPTSSTRRDRIDGLKPCCPRSPRRTRSPPPAPGVARPLRGRPLRRPAHLRCAPSPRRRPGPHPRPGASLATAAAVGGETVVLPLVARNRVIGMLTLGKPTDDHFRQEILELAEDLSRGRPSPSTTPVSTASAPPSVRASSAASSRRSCRTSRAWRSRSSTARQARATIFWLGGDFYDLFPIRDGAYGFAIGDVCGTGPEAAAVTGLARHALRLLAREGFGGPRCWSGSTRPSWTGGPQPLPHAALRRVWPQVDGSALLKVVCAGHPLPLRLRQDGTVEPAAEPQPLLGVMDDLELYEQTVTLDPGDVLLCVTDGVTERREGARMLGDDGLADVLTTCTGLTAGAVAARVLRAVERFAAEPASDDMAILAMRVPERQED
ncbi:GAF domain-containing SpoIIE family protein phosphatase [Streptomyces cinnamoneus]|uniref:GAF domain-containing SpoIIE family protein phosphatase n=1 Tax=Streptomyces cinnamoneus TaxID=53446 RepID=UPI0023D927B8|nr:GAF domain-containing SpoIIE family protein phosphatase [Streptomyces cinnamoneus]